MIQRWLSGRSVPGSADSRYKYLASGRRGQGQRISVVNALG